MPRTDPHTAGASRTAKGEAARGWWALSAMALVLVAIGLDLTILNVAESWRWRC